MNKAAPPRENPSPSDAITAANKEVPCDTKQDERVEGKLHGKMGEIMSGQVDGNIVVVRWRQFCVCVCVCIRASSLLILLFTSSLSSFTHQVSTTSARQTKRTAKWKTGWATADDVIPAAARWWWSDGLCMYEFVFMCDSVSVVVAAVIKELLWPHFCFITPSLPLSIHTRVCEVTYGVIARCQWTSTHTTLTWKHSMEHSEPLMASNGEWHQSCDVSCYFSLFLFHFSLLLFWWTQVKSSASLDLMI